MFLWAIAAHWVADFVCQTHWMASNKSKNWYALFLHVAVYSALMADFVAYPFGLHLGQIAIFFLITFVTHGLTDAVTSRITSKLFGKDWHNFFVVVGADQLIHYTTLWWTLRYLGSI